MGGKEKVIGKNDTRKDEEEYARSILEGQKSMSEQ